MSLGIFDAKRPVRRAALGDPTLLIAAGAAGLWYLTRPERARERIVSIAASQIGQQNPDKYWQEVSPSLVGDPVAWCGGFALWVLRHAGVTDLMWKPEIGFLGNLPQTKTPKKGDIAYFDDLQHHAVVVSADGKTLVTIDGNQGPGEQVKQRVRPQSAAHSFYSIAKLIGEAA